MFAKWVVIFWLGLWPRRLSSLGHSHSTVTYIRLWSKPAPLYWCVPFLFMSSHISLSLSITQPPCWQSNKKFTNKMRRRAQQRDLAEPITPFTMMRSSEKNLTTLTMRRIRAKRSIRRTFKLDKSIDSVDAATSRITSSTSATVTKAASIAFQWIDWLYQDRKWTPSTMSRRTNSRVNSKLKPVFKTRKTTGEVTPMFWTLQWASTPIKSAHSRIRLAQNHSNAGDATTLCAARRQAGQESMDESPCDCFWVNFARISFTPVTLVFSSFQGTLNVALPLLGLGLLLESSGSGRAAGASSAQETKPGVRVGCSLFPFPSIIPGSSNRFSSVSQPFGWQTGVKYGKVLLLLNENKQNQQNKKIVNETWE